MVQGLPPCGGHRQGQNQQGQALRVPQDQAALRAAGAGPERGAVVQQVPPGRGRRPRQAPRPACHHQGLPLRQRPGPHAGPRGQQREERLPGAPEVVHPLPGHTPGRVPRGQVALRMWPEAGKPWAPRGRTLQHALVHQVPVQASQRRPREETVCVRCAGHPDVCSPRRAQEGSTLVPSVPDETGRGSGRGEQVLCVRPGCHPAVLPAWAEAQPGKMVREVPTEAARGHPGRAPQEEEAR
mmetsp:Transcript_23771/g.61754  ORF Transcript_23771/g.61754 Transcript_23771/m.61754 type:complete len:240 (+) Transcript_23771:1233-1952(+)